MLLEKLSLKNFRNHEDQSFTFTSGINLIYGKNGVGKTSILEAIYLLSTGKSFRTPSLDTLIRKGSSNFLIQAHFRKDQNLYKLNFFYSNKEKKVTCQGTPLKRYSDLLGMFPSVLYSTQDHHIVTGSPSERRRFLNMILGQTDPLYVSHFVRFMRCLKQRNALLKAGEMHALHPFEQMLSEAGSYIMEQRSILTTFLSTRLKAYARQITLDPEEYELNYQSCVLFDKSDQVRKELLMKQWDKEREKDRILGSTSSGPHRDDIHLLFNKKPAKQYVSEGQKRTFISAMKFAEYDFIHEKFGEKPIFSIDDFTIHLDQGRVEKLANKLANTSQVFLTAPTAHAIDANMIHLTS